MLKALGDGDVLVKEEVARALTSIGTPEAITELEKALGNVDILTKVQPEDASVQAEDASDKIGIPGTIPELERAVEDKDINVRRLAVEALGEIGGPEAIPALLKGLGDGDMLVRRIVERALESIATPRAISALEKALKDKNELVRKMAANALAKNGGIDVLEHILRIREINVNDPIILDLLRKLVVRHRKENDSLHPLFSQKVEKYRSEKRFADNGEK